jgi:V/A-type H+-transporting ATPase subunit I
VVVAISDQGEREALAVITMQRNDEEVSRVLSRHDFQTHALPTTTQQLDRDAMRDVEAKIASLKEEQSSLNDQLVSIVEDRSEELLDVWANLRMNELYVQLRSHFSHTDHAVVLSGWVPADRASRLESGIRETTDNRCYIEWNSAKSVQDQSRRSVKAPVQLRNPGFLKPFQMLVVNYAVPDYGTVDPTPFVAVSYLAMFGLMFQDVGHGAVLMLLGALGVLMSRDGRSSESGMTSLFRLGIWCGAASVVTGVLFGSYFGMAWLPPLWFDYHGIVAGHGGHGVYSSIFDILELTIYLGITIIALGLVLNWINLTSKRKWVDLIFDKGGVLGGIMYGAGVAIAFEFAGTGFRSLQITPLPLAMVAGSALLLFLKAPIEHLEQRRAGHGEPLTAGSLLWFAMEWVIELLEVFSGYLANTLSFMRVAGLGIAHVTLMMAFFQIAEMASPGPGTSLLGILILVLGNALVIALEGLSAGIQSLRLNYYEFSSKYFTGTGEAYRPVTLKPSR